MSREVYNALKTYREAARTAQSKIQAARDTYKPEAAETEINRLNERLQGEREKAIQVITKDRDTKLHAADEWGRLDGAKVTSDAKLLDAGIVDTAHYQEMIDRYKDNGTMLLILRQYGEERNQKLRANSKDTIPEGLYPVESIPTLQEKRSKIEKGADSAIGVLNMIDNGFMGYGGGADSEMVGLAIENFLNY